MFKFFRQYNKLILVIGAAFLMVAFLIQPVLSMFMTSPQDRPIGRIEGEDVPRGERQTAVAELHLLSALNPALGALANQLAEDDPVKWLLMVRDARRLGIDASRAQVDQMLYEVLGVRDPQIRQTARQVGASDDVVHQAVRHWLMLEQYRALMLGQEHLDPIERFVRFTQRLTLFQQAQQTGNIQLLMQLQQMRGMEDGAVRLSEPLVQWFVANHQATVSGQALLISAEAYLDEVDQPGTAELQEQFDRYRDVPPGESEPFGFGYRYPDRVQLEWLAMPVNELREAVEIDVVDVLEYYREHRDEFTEEADQANETQQGGEATEDADDAEADAEDADEAAVAAGQADTLRMSRSVREEIVSRLRDEEAQQTARRMASEAYAMLYREVRRLEQDGRYRQLPADVELAALEAVADELEEAHGVRPRVEQRTDEWVSVEELGTLPGLGRAHLEGRPNVDFASYVASARELEPGEENPLVSLALQTRVPGRVMAQPDGSRFIFRLTDAQPSHAPQSLDEVREQVARDVRLRMAYEHLTQQREQWISRAASEGLAPLAEENEHVQLQPIRDIPRRTFQGMSDQLEVPSIPGIGQHAALVDRMFEIAERVSDLGREAVDEAPERERTDGVALDRQLSLAVFRVDGYQAVTRGQFEQQAAGPGIEMLLTQLLVGGRQDPLLADGAPALSREAVARRLGFEAIEPVEPGDQDAPGPAPGQRRPGSL